MRRRTTAGLTCALTAAAVLAGSAAFAETGDRPADDKSNSKKSFRFAAFGAFGDRPYGALGRGNYPRVLADINSASPAFTVFDGDTKNGSEPCYADPHT